jgi:hypothetical protein
MGAGAGQNKIVAVDLVEKQPILLNVANRGICPNRLPEDDPLARRKRLGGNKQTQHVTQLRHALPRL